MMVGTLENVLYILNVRIRSKSLTDIPIPSYRTDYFSIVAHFAFLQVRKTIFSLFLCGGIQTLNLRMMSQGFTTVLLPLARVRRHKNSVYSTNLL
jgi:hypothetical protein